MQSLIITALLIFSCSSARAEDMDQAPAQTPVATQEAPKGNTTVGGRSPSATVTVDGMCRAPVSGPQGTKRLIGENASSVETGMPPVPTTALPSH